MTLWDPSYVVSATLACWLDVNDASNRTVTGGAVDQLSDKSGNAAHFPKQNATGPTLGTLGSMNMLDYNAQTGTSNRKLRCATALAGLTNGDNSGGVALWVPITASRVEYAVIGWSGADTNNRYYAALFDTSLSGDPVRGRHGATSVTGANRGANGYNIVTTTRDTSFKVYLNGESTPSVNDTNDVSWNDGIFEIGSGMNNNSNTCECWIGEVVLFTGVLSTDDRQKLEGYLAHKWSAANSDFLSNLDASHPYKSSAPLAPIAEPGLLTNTNTLYAPTVVSPQVLAPGLFTDTDTLYAPTVTNRATITPGLLTNSSTLYTGIVGLSNTLSPPLMTSGNIFYDPTVAQAAQFLLPPLLSDADTLYAPTVGGLYTLAPGFHNPGNTLYAPTVANAGYTLSPPLLTGGGMYEPTVTRGGVTVAPGLFTNTNSFYAATIGRGAVTIAPPLLSDGDTLHLPLVGVGAKTLAPNLFTNTGTLYAPTVAISLQVVAPGLLTNGQTFYAPTIINMQVIAPTLLNLGNTLFAPTVGSNYTASPPLLTNTATFFAPDVANDNFVTAPLIANDNTLFAPTANLTNTLLPPFHTPSGAVYAPVVTNRKTLLPTNLSSANVLYAPTVTRLGYAVLPPFKPNENILFPHKLSGGITTPYNDTSDHFIRDFAR